MKIKIQIKSVFGDVLFELEKENNTLKHTLIEAVKDKYNLRGADLRGADLCDANLGGANLRGAKINETTSFYEISCPEEGSFVGWKKVNNYIIKLQVTDNAKRSSSTSLKCRCSEARVLEIQKLDGSKSDISQISSNRDKNFIYKVGEIVKVDDFDNNRWNECSTGIHFFMNRNIAVNYEL